MAKGASPGNGWNKFVIETEKLQGAGGKVEESFSHQRGAVQIGTDHIQPTGIRIIEWDDTRWSSSTFGSAIGISLSDSGPGFWGWTPTDSQESKTHPAGGKLLLHISVSARAKKKKNEEEVKTFARTRTHTRRRNMRKLFHMRSNVKTWIDSTASLGWVTGWLCVKHDKFYDLLFEKFQTQS